MDKILFAPLTKVVEQADGTLEIWGRAAAQEADPKGEVFDYEASKPFIKNWSEEIAKASGGQSLGNLRAMHNPRLAAGKLTALTFNDAEQTVDVVAKVVDPGEVKKVQEGVYTGFSFGGSYGAKRQVGNLVYYAAVPSELSLADNPMIKSARFTLVKVDGSQEERVFNKLEGSAGERPVLPLQKRLDDVGRMAELLYRFRCFLGNVIYEAEEEQDGSAVPAKLQAAFLALVEIFKEFAVEEAEEMAANVQALLDQPIGMLAMNTGIEGLAKAGARHTAAEMQQIQQIHDTAASLGAVCQGGMEKMATPADLEKLVTDLGERLGKVEGAFTAQGDKLAKVEAENIDLQERLAKVEGQPTPPKGALKAVGKGDDIQPLAKTDGPSQEEMAKNNDTQGLIKAAHANPISLA